MSLYRAFIPQANQMLVNLRGWLDKAEEHAKTLGYDSNVLLSTRLYPNQFELVRQVQTACDTAKLTPSRLASRPAPPHEDNETTFAELRARIDATREYLASFSEEEIRGADSKPIVLPFAKQLAALGEDYVHEFALPNLYFHVGMAYAILRHSGVPLGKQDFIGRITTQPAEPESA